MKTVGLTGSIAMGKTETARLFQKEGVPVFESDKVVHGLYRKGGKAVTAVKRLCPVAVVGGAVDRQRLATALMNDPSLLHKLETAVHPLVREEMAAFLREHRRKNPPFVVLDVPLLFETGCEKEFDIVVVVSAPLEIQKQRALERPGMSEGMLDLILSRQIPDAEKRGRADYVVETGKGIDFARSQVRKIVSQLK
ncbi:MAG TPA: dephospho-CoA kinase [Aestuariivirgaceae bacterium]|jgi:dephospho-CoA kinase